MRTHIYIYLSTYIHICQYPYACIRQLTCTCICQYAYVCVCHRASACIFAPSHADRATQNGAQGWRGHEEEDVDGALWKRVHCQQRHSVSGRKRSVTFSPVSHAFTGCCPRCLCCMLFLFFTTKSKQNDNSNSICACLLIKDFCC